jgi:hypothetical protein
LVTVFDLASRRTTIVSCCIPIVTLFITLAQPISAFDRSASVGSVSSTSCTSIPIFHFARTGTSVFVVCVAIITFLTLVFHQFAVATYSSAAISGRLVTTDTSIVSFDSTTRVATVTVCSVAIVAGLATSLLPVTAFESASVCTGGGASRAFVSSLSSARGRATVICCSIAVVAVFGVWFVTPNAVVASLGTLAIATTDGCTGVSGIHGSTGALVASLHRAGAGATIIVVCIAIVALLAAVWVVRAFHSLAVAAVEFTGILC